MSAISRGGKPMTFAGVTTGSWFGEGSVLKGEPRQYDVVAIRDTRLAMLNKGFNRFLVRQLNERVGQFIATIEHDRILSPRARVARHLSWFFNPVLYPQVRTEIAISQEELGLLAGVSRAVANRSLQELEEEKLVSVEHGKIRVIDLETLKRYES